MHKVAWMRTEPTRDCRKCKHYLEKTCIPNGFDCTYEPEPIYESDTYLSDRDIRKLNKAYDIMKHRIEVLEKQYHSTKGENNEN